MQKKFQVDLTGELTISHLPGYYDSLLQLLDEKMEIILSLKEVQKMDIAGMQMLLCFYNSRMSKGLLTYLDYEENQAVSRLFNAAGTDKLLGSLQ